MGNHRRKVFIAALAGAAAMTCPWDGHAAAGAEWPTGPITMVVPFPAGGPTDMVARMLAHRLAGFLGQAVVVQNLAGASGIVGMRGVAAATADGYTILYNTSSLVLAPHLYLDPGFEAGRDFDAVTSTVAMPLVLLVRSDVPVTDLHAFVAYGRQMSGNLAYASAGGGNVTHLAAVLLLQALDVRAMHVPYRGSAPALAGLNGGQTHFMVNPVGDALPHIRAGRLRALAVTSRERVVALPDVPTIAEYGIPAFQVQAWQGVMVPRGTPAAVVQRLNTAILQALMLPDMQEQLAARGAHVLGSTPDEYARYIHQEYLRWGEVIREAAIRPD
ncbi:LacI family transcriptional regulator [Bordetella genomosp. 9]|uniref:LacI family transcriptional regulator n=1 Tax=Bordetella genomosp. 9 TaxID=1416803 RepID=A0A261R7A5_9BORD|nr:tripartite tricarboxylate transporter substrate binding protein [Bordetella genomosp. 9]OZI20667.1 LacI family transcriptional regulator [Bordetella genomosp. 9]